MTERRRKRPPAATVPSYVFGVHACRAVLEQRPEAIRRVGRISAEHGLPVANVFHAGDGNLHPNIGFDREDPDQMRRLQALGCVA